MVIALVSAHVARFTACRPLRFDGTLTSVTGGGGLDPSRRCRLVCVSRLYTVTELWPIAIKCNVTKRNGIDRGRQGQQRQQQQHLITASLCIHMRSITGCVVDRACCMAVSEGDVKYLSAATSHCTRPVLPSLHPE